jgi:Arc/MetJ-type ribon-helix-helix transcriptional regulator
MQKAHIIETLPDDLRETIEEDVRAGEFTDADEAIRTAILSQHERLALRRSVLEADAACARGEGIAGEQVFNELRTLSAERRKAQ